MRRILILSILLIVVFAMRTAAQTSLVFLPTSSDQEISESERPRQSLRLLKAHIRLQSFVPELQSPNDFPNINVSFFLGADQNEPSIAINPTDPNNIIIGCNDYRSDSSLWYFTSTDGGLSWAGAPHRSNWQFSNVPFDPAVVFDHNGTAYFCNERSERDGIPYAINDLVFFKSTTKGASWDLPVRVVLDSNSIGSASQTADKGYICVDDSPTSPFSGRIYISWVVYESGKGKIVVSHSSDKGKTWSIAKAVTASANFQCPIPICGVNGDLFISYQDIDPTHRQIHFVRSTDGGDSFNSDVVVSGYNEIGRLYPPGKNDAHPVIKGHLRVNSFPSIALDHSNLHFGRIYMTWAGKDNNARTHIYLTTSDDRGSHWTTPTAIEADANTHATDKFFPWIAVDRTNGDVGIVCYDSRNDSLKNEFVDAYMLFSRDGGSSFTPLRLTSNSFDPKVSSSIDSLGNTDTLQFLGDYLALDVASKHWYPSWADGRVGYDQDLYVALVRPYSPLAPKVFTASEQASTHFALLNWQYDPKTMCGIPLGSFQFRLRREDNVVDILLPSTDRSFVDNLATQTQNHIYTIQVVTQDGDTSARASVKYYPRAEWESKAPELLSGEANTNGFYANVKVPSQNIAGLPITGLYQFFFILDGTTIDTIKITDANSGKTSKRLLLVSPGYHKLQLQVATRLPEGDTILSLRSEPRWLYGGDPRSDYSENFSSGKDIFTPFSWDTTSVGATSPAKFINDSLPLINYNTNSNSWFCLPSVQILDGTRTLEFDHIASVAIGDSAILEFSTDDGVHFQPMTFWDQAVNPNNWHSSVTTSLIIHETIGFKKFIGSNVIVRFRLATHSSGADGWFVTNLHFTDLVSVREFVDHSNNLQILSNPLHSGELLKAKLTTTSAGKISIAIFDLLGRKKKDIAVRQQIVGGEYLIETEVAEGPGCYIIECREETPHGIIQYFGRYIMLP